MDVAVEDRGRGATHIDAAVGIEVHRGKAGAGGESPVADIGHRPRDGQRGEVAPAGEGMLANRGDGVGNGHCRHVAIGDGGERVGDDQQRETRAAIESTVADGGDGAAECHRAEIGAIGKGPFADGVHRVGDGDGGEVGAVIEGVLTDAHHGVGGVVVGHRGGNSQRACGLHGAVPPGLLRSVGIEGVHHRHTVRVKDDVIERVARGCNSPKVIVGTTRFGTICNNIGERVAPCTNTVYRIGMARNKYCAIIRYRNKSG